MHPVAVDLSGHLGAQIRIRIVDESSGPWGHINFDDFRFHPSEPIDRPSRVASNPLLQHLVPNPATGEADPTVAGMWVPEGFEVELIAKEPVITQPIAFTFDERGRIWIAEAHSYPRRQPDGEGKDRIIILEDCDGDGSFEKKTTFATGLNLVSGLEVGFGGVWVGSAPQLLFIPDRDRDDVPDADPVVLLDGWGYADTHETLNSFTWGPDGWLYGNQGVFNHSKIGKPGTPENQRTEMRAGVWRYHPQHHQFEIFATGCSNQWGIDFDEMGHLFITHCRSAWGGGPTSYVVHGGHYWNQSNANHAPFISGGAAGWNPGAGEVFRNFLPSSARYGHGEGGAGKPGSRALYGGHSHVGTMIYLGSNWPEKYRNQLFTHNLHGHQMNRQANEREGSGFNTVHAGSDQLFTPDPRFIGVDLKYGRDGAVYMIDWYDKQHCHTNNADAWDRSDGRLYRMSWAETYQPVKVDLRNKPLSELLKLALSKDEWLSRTARRLIQEAGSRPAAGALADRARGRAIQPGHHSQLGSCRRPPSDVGRSGQRALHRAPGDQSPGRERPRRRHPPAQPRNDPGEQTPRAGQVRPFGDGAAGDRVSAHHRRARHRRIDPLGDRQGTRLQSGGQGRRLPAEDDLVRHGKVGVECPGSRHAHRRYHTDASARRFHCLVPQPQRRGA